MPIKHDPVTDTYYYEMNDNIFKYIENPDKTMMLATNMEAHATEQQEAPVLENKVLLVNQMNRNIKRYNELLAVYNENSQQLPPNLMGEFNRLKTNLGILEPPFVEKPLYTPDDIPN